MILKIRSYFKRLLCNHDFVKDDVLPEKRRYHMWGVEIITPVVCTKCRHTSLESNVV